MILECLNIWISYYDYFLILLIYSENSIFYIYTVFVEHIQKFFSQIEEIIHKHKKF